MGFKVFYESKKDPNPIKGGKGDSLSLKDIPKLTLKIASQVELEHSPDIATARDILRDHIKEDPRYYQKLLKYVEPSEISTIAKKVGISEEDLWKWIES